LRYNGNWGARSLAQGKEIRTVGETNHKLSHRRPPGVDLGEGLSSGRKGKKLGGHLRRTLKKIKFEGKKHRGKVGKLSDPSLMELLKQSRKAFFR